MNFGGPTFVLAIIALSIGGWMFTTWIRAKHGYPVENEWGGTVHRTDVDADRSGVHQPQCMAITAWIQPLPGPPLKGLCNRNVHVDTPWTFHLRNGHF